jgi:hypothetical protein
MHIQKNLWFAQKVHKTCLISIYDGIPNAVVAMYHSRPESFPTKHVISLDDGRE